MTNLKQQNDELKAELAKAQRALEENEQTIAKLKQQDQTNVLTELVSLADMAYNSLNSKALSQAASLEAPSGDGPIIRDHRGYRNAFESVLDGIHEALDGYRNGTFQRYGLRDNIAFYRKKLAEEMANHDNQLFTDAGKPVTEDAGALYDRYVETTTLVDKLEKMAGVIEQAFDNASTGDSDGYVTKQERIAASRKRKLETEKKVEEIGDKLDAILASAPKLEIKRSA